MLVSNLFAKTRKQDPADEQLVNAKLLTRAGFLYKNMAGVYSYLPLGFLVLQNIRRVIREELGAIGAEEVYLNELQDKATWEASGRWDELKDIMYQFKDSRGKELGLATTHEEVVAKIAKEYINSYKDMPKGIFQIQDKFRNEPRARSGLLRGREFEMKDLYSFHSDNECLDRYYQMVAGAYKKIFTRLGIDAIYTTASGGSFSQEPSHEFQAITENGEDTIYYCVKCQIAKNKEIVGVDADEIEVLCDGCGGKLEPKRSIEVGNIFKLGTKFSKAQNLFFKDKDGKERLVIMASYGIGTGRAMATIAEINSDESGLVWNLETAPYKAYVINLTKEKLDIPENIEQKVLYDDGDISAGEKFADADLLGIPYRIVKSQKTGDKFEIKHRKSGKIELITWQEFAKKINV